MKLYFAAPALLVNGQMARLSNLTADTLFNICSPGVRLRNNDDDDQDAAQAGPYVEALGQVEVVLARETVGKVDRSHAFTFHNLEKYFSFFLENKPKGEKDSKVRS